MIKLRSIEPSMVLIAIGHVLFFGLFVLAAKHYQERCIHVDSAFQIFKWIQYGGVEVEAYRFSAVIPQLIVKLSKGFGLDLRSLLIIASMAHVLVPYVIFILAAHVWRVRWVAAGCALAAVLCTRLTFYGIVLEANYLLCYPFLLAAVLFGPLARIKNWKNMALVVVALFTVLAAHPVGFLIAIYVLAIAWIFLPLQRKLLVGMTALSVLWGLLRPVLMPPSGYERDLYGSVVEGVGQLEQFTAFPSLEFLVGHTWAHTTQYLPVWILMICSAALFVYGRNWLLLIVSTGGCLGYLLLNVVTYHSGETAMMMEKNFVPLATLIAMPLLLQLELTGIGLQRWAVVGSLVVVFVQFRAISFASRPAHERYAAIERLVASMQDQDVKKAIMPKAELDRNGIHIHWALQFETLLTSSLDGPEESITVLSEEFAPINDRSVNVHLPPKDPDLAADRLDERYFFLPTGPYIPIVPLPAKKL